MREIESIQELNGIVTAFQKRYKKVSTNCYLMREELIRLIEERKLRLFQDSGLLILLCARPDYDNLYYYTGEEVSIPDLSFLTNGDRKDKEVLLDIISSQNRPGKNDPFISSMLSENRISKYKCYQRMAQDLTGGDFRDFSYELPKGCRLMTGSISYAEIISLWKTVLDEKSTPLPDIIQLERLQKEGTLSCVENIREGRPCAVVTLDIQGNLGILQHLSVLPQYRRQGLAGSLCKRVISQALQSGLKTLRLWVDIENTTAITLYRREGFSPDGILCNQYYFR